MQTYVCAVLELAWVRRRWQRAATPIVVRERAGQSRAHYERSPAVIAVPLHRDGQAWALRELVVLHEVAHHLAAGAEPAHGRDFTGRMVDLVGGVVGEEAALLLRVTLLESGVAVG